MGHVTGLSKTTRQSTTKAPKIGVICGFRAEVDCFWRAIDAANLERQNFEIAPSGSSAEKAEMIADKFITDGVDCLVSFGIAGALDPQLPVGASLIAKNVSDEGQQFQSRLAFAQELGFRDWVYGSPVVIFDPAEKARLFSKTQAVIVDLESGAVARTASAADIPFLIIRTVSDSANDSLPAYVAKAVDEEGNPRIGPVMTGLIKNPASLIKLLTLKRNTDMAIASLERTAREILPKLLGSL